MRLPRILGVDEAVMWIATGADKRADDALKAGAVDAVAGPEQLRDVALATLQGGVETVPQALIDQLKDGGRIAALFMDGALGAMKIGHKTGTKMVWRFAFNAAAPVMTGFASRHAFAL